MDAVNHQNQAPRVRPYTLEVELGIYDEQDQKLANNDPDLEPRSMTWRQLQQEWSSTISSLLQHVQKHKQIFGAADSTLDMLFGAVETYFATDIKMAGLQYLVMKRAVDIFELLQLFPNPTAPFQLSRRHFFTESDPIYYSTLLSWSDCKSSLMMVALFGSPKDLTRVKRVLEFAGGATDQEKEDDWRKEVTRELKTGSSQSLAKTLLRARKEITQGGGNNITVLYVHLLDTYRWREQLDAIDETISFIHYFTLAAGFDGIRIFQSYGPDPKMPHMTMWRHMLNGGARLRSWDEAAKFVEDFKILSTAAPAWSSKQYDAYARCFDYDLRSNIASAFPHGQKHVSPTFEPHVRILEFSNVTPQDIQKFDWSQVAEEEHLDFWKVFHVNYPHLTPQQKPGIHIRSAEGKK
ncbi:hypothetical protein FKW77_002347 [Venturia effusa]|uniref:Uncharacterized protein n=1 Tax=Venturia effusa TaxID=50376 RepID=A0A517LMK0_9PEZI|nr:hypothetical protein FKW77_002347 [Venturia effusa]